MKLSSSSVRPARMGRRPTAAAIGSPLDARPNRSGTPRAATFRLAAGTESATHVLLTILAALLLGGIGCGPATAPPPSTQQAVEEFRGQVAERAEAMSGTPRAAAQQLGLLIESLEGYAGTHGEPFTGWLAKARELQAAWGTAPTRQQVAEGVETLRQALGE